MTYQVFADEAAKLETDILYTEKSHFAHEQGARLLHWIFGLGGSTTSVLAAAAILRDVGGAWLPSILALLATLCSAVLTFARPVEAADSHSRSGRALNALRVELRQLRRFHIETATAKPDFLRTELKKIARRKEEIDGSAPSISDRRYRQARRKLEGT